LQSRNRCALTRRFVADLVDEIVVVSEQSIEEAIGLGAEIEKTILEGAGAAGSPPCSSTAGCSATRTSPWS